MSEKKKAKKKDLSALLQQNVHLTLLIEVSCLANLYYLSLCEYKFIYEDSVDPHYSIASISDDFSMFEHLMNRMIEMERKVTKFGNSLGITMTDALKQIGLDQGDTVSIEVSPATGEVIIKKSTKVSLPEGIRADFMDTLTMSLKNTITL